MIRIALLALAAAILLLTAARAETAEDVEARYLAIVEMPSYGAWSKCVTERALELSKFLEVEASARVAFGRCKIPELKLRAALEERYLLVAVKTIMEDHREAILAFSVNEILVARVMGESPPGQ
jgi:hypothetical protein